MARRPSPTRRPPASALSWADVVSRVRLVANGEPDRLTVLSSLDHYWRPFLSAWTTASSFLTRCGEDITLDPAEYAANTLDQNLAWAWDAVDPHLDAALHTVDSRCQLSSAVCFQIFEVMRGAALILPDGSCLPIVRELSDNHARAEKSALLARSVMNAWKVNRAIAASNPAPENTK